jgi:hypothetical protein
MGTMSLCCSQCSPCISQMCSWILSNVPMLFPMFPCISQMCSWILSNVPMLFPMHLPNVFLNFIQCPYVVPHASPKCVLEFIQCPYVVPHASPKCVLEFYPMYLSNVPYVVEPLLFRQGLNIHYNTFNTRNSLHLMDRWSWCIQEYTIFRASPQGTLMVCQHQDKD